MMQCVATVLIVLFGLVFFSHAKENQCPGGKASCPDDSTCCFLSNGSFGCCPIQNAVCCGDSVHCCPDGYICDVIKGICTMGRELVPLLKKLPAKPTMKVTVTMEHALDSASDGPISPDKKYQCPKESTCCKLPSGTYGCCPSENAVCCSDHKHCCPGGYTCDVEAGKCKKGAEHINMIKNIHAIETSIGKCSKTAEHINMIETIPATKTSIAGDYIEWFQTKEMLRKTSALKTEISAALLPIRCPDGRYCNAGQTCCPWYLGGYNCCPAPGAICCRDRRHCCPAGSVCDFTSTRCLPGSQSIAVFQKKVTVTKEHALDSASDGPISPDKKYQCPKESTCCKLPSGTYGCCPSENAVCCSDHKHCCPGGYTCDVEAGECKKGAEHINMIKNIHAIKTSIGKCSKTAEHINMIETIPATKTSIAGEYIEWFQTKEMLRKSSALKTEISAALNPIICPDGRQCHAGQTCCRWYLGGYNCCPAPGATCCRDRRHCCPAGSVCDFTSLRCIPGS